LRRRGIQSAHGAGNSLGGWLALELGRRGFAQSVVVFSPAGAWQTPGDYRAIARSFRIVFGAMPLIVVMTGWLLRLAGMRKLLGRQTMEHGERVPATEFRAMLTAMKNTRVLPGLLKTMGRDGPIAPLTTGEVPVRVVWGGCDRVIPFDKYGRPMLLRIPAAQFREIPAVGHVPMYDDPRAVSAAILDFTAAMDRRQTEERARP
jgi:pimeloyl-ACP methyl ester carboxylesterase